MIHHWESRMLKILLRSGFTVGCLLGMPLAAGTAAGAATRLGLEGVPAYDVIVVIEMENRQYGQIIGAEPATSPHMTALSRRYNSATQYYGITHVSQPNYISLMGGDQHGLNDDDPWYCEADGSVLPQQKLIVAGQPDTADTSAPCHGYAHNPTRYLAHHFNAPSLFQQMNADGLSWSMFNQSMPMDSKTGKPQPEIPVFPTRKQNPDFFALYVSKHNPSLSFDDVREAPDFLSHNRTETDFLREAASGTLPRFSYVIPDLCHDDHGPGGALTTAPQCRSDNAGPPALLTTGDDYVEKIVDAVRASPLWRSPEKVAVVVTFDEDDYGSAGIQGCCGYHPALPGQSRVGPINQGGGRIPTIVITNHGVTGIQDATPYNHYSLLRTIEDSFGIATHLGHAADNVAMQPADGAFKQTPVLPMVPMFRIADPTALN